MQRSRSHLTGELPSLKLIGGLRVVVGRLGVQRAVDELGINRLTLTRLLAGVGVRHATIVLAEKKLEEFTAKELQK